MKTLKEIAVNFAGVFIQAIGLGAGCIAGMFIMYKLLILI